MTLNDSTEGRWLTPDLLGGDITNPQSLNRYAYALNNPTTLTDPLGLDSCTSTNSPDGSVTTNCTVTGSAPSCDPSDIQCLECTQMQVCVQPAPSGCNAYTGVGCGPGENGGGVVVAPKPAPKPAPPASRPPTFLGNIFQTTWNSFKNPNGCDRLLFSTFANDLNPIPTGPSLADTIKPAADFTSAVLFNKALGYAAAQPNVLGGTGLLYPLKSSVVQNLMKRAQAVEDIVPEITISYATADAVYSAADAAYNGECH